MATVSGGPSGGSHPAAEPLSDPGHQHVPPLPWRAGGCGHSAGLFVPGPGQSDCQPQGLLQGVNGGGMGWGAVLEMEGVYTYIVYVYIYMNKQLNKQMYLYINILHTLYTYIYTYVCVHLYISLFLTIKKDGKRERKKERKKEKKERHILQL